MSKIIGLIDPPNSALDSDYGLPFRDQGTVYLFSKPKDTYKFDVVVFPGGPDVDPSLYGQDPHPKTHFNSKRDKHLLKVYNLCLQNKIPMVGICGGMQFLSVANGLKLRQHITGHKNTGHKIYITHLHKWIDVNSDHHQEVISRNKTENIVLAYSKDIVIEAILFPRTRCLGVQYHPEWMPKESDGYIYFQQLLEEYIL